MPGLYTQRGEPARQVRTPRPQSKMMQSSIPVISGASWGATPAASSAFSA
eukprot:CAMPEP_0198508888 /NCGR_PEP_ID=MMETSP1462-20131121/13237_1 /TAXON_ID=1333877 /ORGANISM="Brandtodinium nutriculum, Strain RCC3387" /LENGTH=49 /DNA_ID= /DNA_START= /DNA_END= /DNA_ORIENTATION=